MKEVKAYVRQHRISDVLEALRNSGLCGLREGSGCHNITVSQVQRPQAGADPSQQHYSIDLAEPVVSEFRLELICQDELATPLAEVIADAASTGHPDAGWIIVSDVQRAVSIK